MIDMKVIGSDIRKERKKQLLTIEQLAEKAGITENFLGKIERGDGIPSLPTIDNIACALHVGIDFLKGEGDGCADNILLNCIMEINQLEDEKKKRFLDFIRTNIQYFQ